MKRQIVITGLGVVSPLGHDLAVLTARLGQRPEVGGSGRSVRLGDAELWSTAGLASEHIVNRRLQRKLDPFCVNGMVAADMALRHSGLPWQTLDAARIGISVGNCLGGWAYTQPELEALHTRGVSAMGPYVATAWFPAALQGQISLAYGFKGHSKTFSARDVAGLQAVGHAALAIDAGRADVMLCGASEDLSSPYMQAVLARYARANGSAPGVFGRLQPSAFSDGAAFLVLEERSHAERRGATVLCTVTGFADRFCGEPAQAVPVLAAALAAAQGERRGERLLLRDGLHADEPALVDAAARLCGLTVTPIDTRGSLANQFAVSGVTEVVLAAQALGKGRLRADTVGGVTAGGHFGGALLQRLSPRGGVAALGLAAV